MKPASLHATASSPAERTARLEARITPTEKALLERAAALTGSSLTDFVVRSAHERALRTIQDHEILTLSARDSEAFIAALLNPPAPGPRLQKAASAYTQRLQAS